MLSGNVENRVEKGVQFVPVSESESEIVYSIGMHGIHLQIKLHNTITHTHVNRSWHMESPQRHRRSKVANPTAASSPAAPPAVIKQLRVPPATTKVARSATAPPPPPSAVMGK